MAATMMVSGTVIDITAAEKMAFPMKLVALPDALPPVVSESPKISWPKCWRVLYSPIRKPTRTNAPRSRANWDSVFKCVVITANTTQYEAMVYAE